MGARLTGVRGCADQICMVLVTLGLAVAVLVLEVLRVALYPFGARANCRESKIGRLVVLVDGECAVCSALRSHVLHRLRRPEADAIIFLPAQRVLDADASDDPEADAPRRAVAPAADAVAQEVRDALATAGKDTSRLLDELHAVEDSSVVYAGAPSVLRLFDACHAPYPLAACAARRLVPRAATDAASLPRRGISPSDENRGGRPRPP